MNSDDLFQLGKRLSEETMKLFDLKEDRERWTSDVLDMAAACRFGILVVVNANGKIEISSAASDRLQLAGALMFALKHVTEVPDE